MSANSPDHGFVDPFWNGPIYARQTGARAAMAMGAGASLILAAAAILVGRPPQLAPNADAGAHAAIEAPAKISDKAGASLDSTLGGKTVASLDIDAPEFAQEKKIVAVGETKDGEPRVDSITVGQFGLGASFLRVDVHPELDAKTTSPDFFLDMTRHARAAGLNVAKIGQRATVTTRFGAFETADIRLSHPGGEGVDAAERACLAGRLVEPKASLEIAGIACGPAARPIDRVAFGCLLDKVSYSAGGDNRTLNDFFLNAELARGKGCPTVSRDDLTASIPPQKTARPRIAAKKPHAAPRSAAVHPETVKN